jgi:Na+/proline symporter
MFTTMATHGTDQDMVQRMLTAKNRKESARATILSGVADFPVVFAVLAIGILLSVYYQHVVTDPLLPRNAKGEPESSQIFPHFVLTVMPGGLRGLVIAGVLATTMGSLGTALNSLATSYCRDFHFRWFRTPDDDLARVSVIRWATVVFALILIGIGLLTAFIKAHNPDLRIIPIILGSFGYTYGSLLGVFMVGLFTKTRGSERGNLLAMLAGFLVVAVMSNLHTGLYRMIVPEGADLRPAWLPELKFTWRILCGTLVTFAVAMCFRTPEETVRRAAEVQ